MRAHLRPPLLGRGHARPRSGSLRVLPQASSRAPPCNLTAADVEQVYNADDIISAEETAVLDCPLGAPSQHALPRRPRSPHVGRRAIVARSVWLERELAQRASYSLDGWAHTLIGRCLWALRLRSV